MFGGKERQVVDYKMFVPEESRADKCTKCGACLPKCPHHIQIPTEMENIAAFFASD
jgi:predicted aldo/keto reductase-like oxidoreductase